MAKMTCSIKILLRMKGFQSGKKFCDGRETKIFIYQVVEVT